MLYLIDSGNYDEINDALAIGAQGVTANTSMYLKNEISLKEFINYYSKKKLNFLSAEVIGTYEEMLSQALEFHKMNNNIVIKNQLFKRWFTTGKRIKAARY